MKLLGIEGQIVAISTSPIGRDQFTSVTIRGFRGAEVVISGISHPDARKAIHDAYVSGKPLEILIREAP